MQLSAQRVLNEEKLEVKEQALTIATLNEKIARQAEFVSVQKKKCLLYDDFTACAVKGNISMQVVKDKAQVRQSERDDKRTQASQVLYGAQKPYQCISSVSSNVSVRSVAPSRSYYHGRNLGADYFMQRRLLADELVGRVARRSSQGEDSSYWRRTYESECEANNRGSGSGIEYAFNNRGDIEYAFNNRGGGGGGGGGSVHSQSVHHQRVGRMIEVMQAADDDLDTDSGGRDRDANGRAIPDYIIYENEKDQGDEE